MKLLFFNYILLKDYIWLKDSLDAMRKRNRYRIVTIVRTPLPSFQPYFDKTSITKYMALKSVLFELNRNVI